MTFNLGGNAHLCRIDADLADLITFIGYWIRLNGIKGDCWALAEGMRPMVCHSSCNYSYNDI